MFRIFLALPFFLASCFKDETISGYLDTGSVFALVSINGAIFGARATIEFPEKGRIEGQGPCNFYSAEQSAPLPWFEIGPIRSTRKACANLQNEAEYFRYLSKMSQIETLGNVVILRDDSGVEMVFRADQD